MQEALQTFRQALLKIAVAVVLPATISFAQPSGASAPSAATAASAPTDQSPLLAKQSDLVTQLDELGTRRKTLIAQIGKAEGDQREALRLQVRDVEKDVRRALGELANLVEALRKEGLDEKEIVARGRELMQAEAAFLQADIEALRTEVAALRKDPEKLDSTELVARKERIAKQGAIVDALLGELHENTERAQRLGADTSNARVFLDKVIENRASTVAGEIKLAVDRLASLRKQTGKAADSDKEKLEAQVAALETEKNGATASLGNLIALMKKRGADDTAYSELLIRATGQISTDTLSVDVAKSFLEHQLADAEKWLRERGPAIGFKVLVVLVILTAFVLLAKIVRGGVRRLLRRPNLGASRLMQRFAARISATLVMLVGLLVVLAQFNIEVGHMLAGLGIAGFIVGFALQDVLANFAAGIMILAYRPYDVGDWIEVPDAAGKVQEMNLVSTTILTGDNQKLLVPNKKIWGSIIRNVTAEDTRRVDLSFGIGYSEDIDRAVRVFREILDADERVLESPEPVIRLVELADSSVNFIVRPWCRTEHYWELRWQITRRVKERFDEEGISIPFPQRDVHLHGMAPQALAAAR